VPEGLAAKSLLLLHLNVSGNQLSGSPDFAGALWPLERLHTLDLSHNQFSGPVTDGIAKLHNLKTLSLSANWFFGAVPADIGLCPHLSTIDLRHRPDVPAWLGKLAAVQHLDLSDNALTGSLPDSLGDLKALKYLRLSRNQLSGIVPASTSMSRNALLSKATEIGHGVFGTVYRAPVGDGRVVAVKKLVSANMVRSREEFEREVRVLGKARHPNLLPLKGYYWTPQLQLLITDYAAHGSLEARLHGREELPPMTWEERFRVVSGTSRALAHMHQAFRPPLVHYNVKPSNIFLLDAECNPAVGDFGLARLLPGKLADGGGRGSRFQAGGGMGYVAPELACQSVHVNEKCDIYGLGMLILELVTGRRAVEYGDDDVVVLMDQVRVLLEHGNALECVDPGMGGQVSEEEVLPVLKLGMVCTSQIPSNRPSMAEVVQIQQVVKAPVGGSRMEASF